MELKQLSIGYSGSKQDALFREITASISSGMFIALFGRNGIGKSTLLKTMAGLLPPMGGSVLLKGSNLQKWAHSKIAREIAFVPAQTPRTPRLSVTDMVGLGRYSHTNWIGSEREIDKEIIDHALEATDLKWLSHCDSSSLSDGELQRASIARSLAQESPLIFLDEPTAFLDMGNKYKIVYLLKELTRNANKGILFSTHDLSLALGVCDVLWIMEDHAFHVAPPIQLIQKGVLDALFSSSGLSFDPVTLTYHPKNHL